MYDLLDTLAIYVGLTTGTVEGVLIKYTTKFRIMFREIREVKGEKLYNTNKENENWKNIKPEHPLTMEEFNKFCQEEFERIRESK